MGGCGSKTANTKVDEQQQKPPKAEAVATGKEDQVLAVPKLTHTITIEKASDDEKWGMTISGPRENAVFVKAIKEEGTVATYNSTKVGTIEAQVCAGDLIVEVNGVSGDAEKMHQELGKGTKFVITLQRDAPAAESTTPAPVETVPVEAAAVEAPAAETTTAAPVEAEQDPQQEESATKIAEPVPEAENEVKVVDTTAKEETVTEVATKEPECESADKPMDVTIPDVAIVSAAVETAEVREADAALLPEADGAAAPKAWCGWSC